MLWVTFYSPLLAVREVKLRGAEHTTVAEVEDASALSSADNLLLTSTDEVARRIEELPWVKSARVDRRLPGTVTVTVTERRPALALSLATGTFTVDRRGRVLSEGRVDGDLPVLAGVRFGLVELGERLAAPELTSALRAYSSLPRGLRADVTALLAPTVERITLQLSDGMRVRYGAAEKLASKNEVLGVLIDRLRAEGRSASYVDVRVPEAPAVGRP